MLIYSLLIFFLLDGKKYKWCVAGYAQSIFNIYCGLRNIEQFKYLAFHDDDEIILPKKVEQYFSK